MQTFDKERFVFENYRMTPYSRISFFGNFFRCHRISILTRSFFFRKSWIDSSSKSAPSPDFYNEKHHVMMEVMRVDDYLNLGNEKHPHNSASRANALMEKLFGDNYKETKDDPDEISVYCVLDTSNSAEYNFKGYLQNFERVVSKHSMRVDAYHRNHPKCKELIFMIFDESNAYYQLLDGNKKNIHLWFKDHDFVEIIKKCRADYVIWFCVNKSMIHNNKEIKLPIVCIYDVKGLKDGTMAYDHNSMLNLSDEQQIR